MSIHELSSVIALPELDLFGVPPTQHSIIRDVQSEHRPISSLNNSTSPIQFEIRSGEDEYIQFRECELYMRVRVNLDKVPANTGKAVVTADDWDKISTANYLLHSMIKQVTVTIGNTLVTSTSRFYPYRAMFEALLNHSYEAQSTTLSQSLFYKDQSDDMDGLNSRRSKFLTPNSSDITKGREIELIGKLHIDLTFQDRALLGGSNITVTVYPNDPKFYLKYDNSLLPTVEFLDSCLYIHRSKVSPSIVEAHKKALKINNAKYFICRKEVKSFIINKGTMDGFINNVESGPLPRRIAVACVSNEAFNGHNKLNPFNFKNYNIKNITCYIDGMPYPARGYQPEFNNGKYAREYFGLFEAYNQTGYTSHINITAEEYKNGYTIFGFNFAPDLAEGCNNIGYVSPIKYGTLRVEIKFNKALEETINVIVFCEYDSLIELPESREAVKTFN